MAGARIKDITGAQTTFSEELVLLVDRIDTGSGDWLQARKLELGLLGNTYFQGSSNGINWHNEILAEDTYFRYSSDGGTVWTLLDTDNIREGVTNLYYTEAKVSANTDVAANTSARHVHTNLPILENIINNGPGTNILTDDGTYKSASLLEITLQDAYDQSSSEPEILTDTTRGALSVQRGSTLDTDNVLEILNGIGTTTASIDGEGVLSSVGVNFNSTTAPTITSEGTVWWNGDEYTLNIESGLGPTLQIGQEVYLLYYNDTGVQIDNFSILHLKGGTTFNGYTYPTPELADASDWEKCQGTLAVATQDIPNGSLGFAILYGRARGGDTSGLVAGSQLWLSATTPGALTSTKPMFPDYSISLGGSFNSTAAPNGELFINITKDIYDTFNDAWDGAIRETFDFTVTSNGTTITGSLANADGVSNLTLLFSDDFYTFDTTPAATVTLTPGTATVPQANYIFIDKATKTLQVSTSSFPTAEHAKVAIVAVLSAASTQTYGALRNQNINDHLKATDDNGHILHMAERIRVLNAEWDSGIAATLTGTTTNVYINTTAGVVYQMHKQVFPAQSMAIGDDIHVINDPITPYRTTTNLNDITVYSDGSTWNNEWSNIVIWGVANKTGEISHIMCNLPSAGYNSEEAAIADASNYSNYTIPKMFKGVGFLIARFTIRRSSAVFTYNSGVGYLDLRGYFPNNTAGGGTGSSGINEYTQLLDTPASYVGSGQYVVRVNAGETGLEFYTPTNWDIAYNNRITSLTTTGFSGAATLVSNTLNIPNYVTGLTSGYLPYFSTKLADSPIYTNGTNVGVKTSSLVGALTVLSGTTGTTFDLLNQANGSVTFSNNAGAAAYPTITGKSNNGYGLSLISATNNTIPIDMLFNVRENDNTDYSTLTTSAFRFSRFNTSLFDILRNGNATLLGSLTIASDPYDSSWNGLQEAAPKDAVYNKIESMIVAAPATAASTGTAGQIAYDSSYIYMCVATDTWKRSAISSW